MSGCWLQQPSWLKLGFETYSLGFVYNTAQHPLCLTDMDGDLRDELVRVGTDGSLH